VPTPISVSTFFERDDVVVEATPEITFKYAQLETAIASIHNVPAKAMMTFKSRLKHFQRIGLVPSSPGKGQKIAYRIGDAIKWALCFEFAELGLPPEQVKVVVYFFLSDMLRSFQGPVQEDDQIFILQGNFLEWHLNEEDKTKWGEGEPNLGTLSVSKLCDTVFRRENMSRVLMINLTHLKRELGKALDIEWT